MRNSILLLATATSGILFGATACGSSDCRDTLTCPVTYVETGGGGGASNGTNVGSGGDASSAGGASTTSGSGGNGGAITYPDVLSLGRDHSCYATGGALKCWGRNEKGQLGVDIMTPSVNIATGVSLAGVVDVASGWEHTCAVLDDGTVNCWGGNDYGQLGNGATGVTPSYAPQEVLGISNATEVSAGPFHTCALLADGSAKCWGRNNAAQLGTGLSSSKETIPVDVSLVGIKALGAKGAQCAILANDTLWCWGNVFSSGPPSPVVGLAAVRSFCQGQEHTCAVQLSGEVYCWGEGQCGQLGSDTEDLTNPMLVPGLPTDFDAVACGPMTTMAIRNDQTVRFWGALFDSQGMCEDIEDSPLVVPTLNRALVVDAGASHKCVKTDDGLVACWGENAFGQLGDGPRPRLVRLVWLFKACRERWSLGCR